MIDVIICLHYYVLGTGAEAYQEIDYADNEPCSTPGDIRLKSQGSIYKIAYLQYCDPSQYKWSWVCADDWNARAAEVACRQFGALPQNYVREGKHHSLSQLLNN